MTSRLKYPIIWADGGTATDPDLDTTHPSYEADRYETKGWHSEKPPEYWQNFLSQITDQKVVSFILDGIPEKDSSVTYAEGAVYQDAGKYYTIKSGVAKECLSVEYAAYVQLLATMKKLLDDHLAADNPHQDTVDTLVDGSYIKSDVDLMFGDPTDPRTIIYHIDLTERAHNETPQQLGTLPVEGGTFTGEVGFLSSAIVAGTPTKLLRLNPSTAMPELSCGGVSIAVDSTGAAWIINGSDNSKILTEALYGKFNISSGYSFALPLPFVQLNLSTTINDLDSVGEWTIETSTDPVFSDKGLDVSTGITLSGVGSASNFTLVVCGWTDTAPSVAVVDLAATTFATMADLITASGVAFEYIKQIWIYPRLNSNQKSMLVTS